MTAAVVFLGGCYGGIPFFVYVQGLGGGIVYFLIKLYKEAKSAWVHVCMRVHSRAYTRERLFNHMFI